MSSCPRAARGLPKNCRRPAACARSEQAQHLAPEQAPEIVDVHEKVRLGRDPLGSIVRQSATRHDHVHVRVMRHRAEPHV